MGVTKLNMIVPKNTTRHWHLKVAHKFIEQGYDIQIVFGKPEEQSFFLNIVLSLDMKLFKVNTENCFKPQSFDPNLFSIIEEVSPNALVLDLTGCATGLPNDALQFMINQNDRFIGVANHIAAGILPSLSMMQNGKILAYAKPMIDNRVSVSRGLQDVFDRAISFIIATTNNVLTDKTTLITAPIAPETPALASPFLFTFLTKSMPRLITEVRRRRKYRSAHWRVGYRFLTGVHKGTGVVQTGDLSGNKWSILPDDGTHFYADPFPFTHKDQAYIFVEDWSHQNKKAVISVSTIDPDGLATVPKPIIEEPWHLSYPQIFSSQNDIWMMPESSEARNLILYRAEDFPEKWVKHKVLIEDRDLSDATLLKHDGKFWLFATDGDEGGSRSDMLVVYQADQIEGPWTPHQQNPITIDRAGARPGGAFIKLNGKIFLPIQDGTLTYGGGLGLVELTSLNHHTVALSPVRPIKNNSEWPYPKIHTLNRLNTLEVIDGIAEVRK